jgi:hypothetical protein
MNARENWFAISIITLFLLFMTAEYVIWEVMMPRGCKGPVLPVASKKQPDPQGRVAAPPVIELHDWPCFYRGHTSRLTKETDSIQEPHELSERLAFQPAESPYRLIPRAADIAHETSVDESGNTKRVSRASVNFNPRSFILYTVLVWQDVEMEIDGESVDMRIYYDAVPTGTLLTR